MIFQEPMTSLNPVLNVGRQIGETLRLHEGLSQADAEKRSIEMLRFVGIPVPERRVKEYPHQLSGGMRQRVMIAMALACNPQLLIADEPTTALDVTIQAQILDLMRDLKTRVGAAIMLITHDLGVVAEMAERVVVMYAGPQGGGGARAIAIFGNPLHPYTRGLLGSVPKLGSSLAGPGPHEADRDRRPGAKPAPEASSAAPSPAAAPGSPISAARWRRPWRRNRPATTPPATTPSGRWPHERDPRQRPRAARGARPQEAFPRARRPVRHHQRLRLRRRRRQLRYREGRDALARRRKRLRQIHRRQGDPPPLSRHRRRGVSRRRPHRQSAASEDCGRCAGASRWCSRTRSPASIRASACATSSPSRSSISASPAARSWRIASAR